MTSLDKLLLADGVCSEEQIDDALRNQVILGGRLGTNLLELGHIDEKTLVEYLSRLHGVPGLYGEDIFPQQDCQDLLSRDQVDRLDVIPYQKDRRQLRLLCIDPADLKKMDEVVFITGMRISPIVVAEVRLWKLLREFYDIRRQLRYITLAKEHLLESLPVQKKVGGKQETQKESLPSQEELVSEQDFEKYYYRSLDLPMYTLAGQIPKPNHHIPEAKEEAILLLEEVVTEVLPKEISQSPTKPESLESKQDLPIGFEEAKQLIEKVSDRNKVARTVLRFGRSLFARCMLFTVHQRIAVAWDFIAQGCSRESFENLYIPLDGPSVFSTVVKTKAHYVGSLVKTRINIEFLRVTGKQVPKSVFAMPILSYGRVVNVLYGDNGHKQFCSTDNIGELLILAQKISQSYDLLFQQKKQAR
jgi:hypothetical protein